MRNKGKSKEQRNSSRERKYSDQKYYASRIGEESISLTNPRGSSLNTQENSTTQSRIPFAVTNHSGNKVNEDTKDLNPNTMEFDRVVKLLCPEFLTDYLKRILTFLKGRNKEICFPNVDSMKEAFLVRLVKEKQNLCSKALNECCGSLCRDILKVLDVNRNSFKWIHSYESGIVRKRVLVYQKINVNCRQESQDSRFKIPQASSSSETNTRSWYPAHTYFTSSENDEELPRNMSRDVDRNLLQRMTNGSGGSSQLSQEQEQFRKMFDALTVPFIMSSLQEILDFIEDNSRQVLNVDAKSAAETKFFKTLPTFLYKESLHQMDKECASLLAQLKQDWNRMALTVKCASPRDDKRQVRRIQITKRRIGNNQSESGRNKRPSRKSRRGRKDKDHNAFLKALSVSTDSEDSVVSHKVDIIRSVVSAARSIDSIYSIPDTDTKRNSSRYQQKRGIQWQPEGHSGLSSTEVKPPTDRGRQPLRRSKLQEALSVPVEPDKAMRMMRLMGWSGGALGTRGDGITEPIMPAIDIVSGAGLGHTDSPTRWKPKERHRDKRKPSNSRTPSDFRREILQNVLDFLRNQNLMEKEIELPEAVDKKGRRFIRTCFQALNARKNLGLNSEEEKDVICRIMSNLNCKPKMGIDYKMSDDKKKCTLIKIEGRVITSKRNKKKFQPTPAFVTQPAIEIELPNNCQSDVDLVTGVDIDNLVDKLRQTSRRASTKSLTALAYRILFLKKIYGFVLSKEEERIVYFKEFLTNRHITYVKNVIDSVNSKANSSYATKTENVLFQDIKGKMPWNIALQANFSENFRSLKLRRIEYKRRFINTSKSTTSTNIDEHAQNNKYTNERDTHCDNDEGIHDDKNYDVEIFEENGEVNDNRETVVLSDSDDSVISLECEYDLDDDESDYNDNGNDDKVDEATYREDKMQYDDRRRSINNDQTDNINEIAVTTDTVSLDDSLDRSYEDSKALFEITDVKSLAIEKPITENDGNSEEMASRVETISINEESNRHTNESMDSDVQEIEIPIIDLDNEEMINYDVKSVKTVIIESLNNQEPFSVGKNTDTNLFESHKIENRLELHENEDFNENPSPASSKRSRTDSESSDSVAKKKKRYISEENYIAIIPNNPDKVIDRKVAGMIQEQIVKHLERNNELPYLECNGIINGSLHYKCFDEKSLHWLDNIVQKLIICDSSFIIIPSTEDVIRRRKSKIKMAAKTHSFLRENPKRILELINVYSPNIRTNEWLVLEEKICDESVIFIVEVDYDSFRSIAKANYSVFAGIDKVDFSRVWT